MWIKLVRWGNYAETVWLALSCWSASVWACTGQKCAYSKAGLAIQHHRGQLISATWCPLYTLPSISDLRATLSGHQRQLHQHWWWNTAKARSADFQPTFNLNNRSNNRSTAEEGLGCFTWVASLVHKFEKIYWVSTSLHYISDSFSY